MLPTRRDLLCKCVIETQHWAQNSGERNLWVCWLLASGPWQSTKMCQHHGTCLTDQAKLSLLTLTCPAWKFWGHNVSVTQGLWPLLCAIERVQCERDAWSGFSKQLLRNRVGGKKCKHTFEDNRLLIWKPLLGRCRHKRDSEEWLAWTSAYGKCWQDLKRYEKKQILSTFFSL